MSPVIGHGHYKRPYRISWRDERGLKHYLSFHWQGPWEREAARLREWQKALVVSHLKVWKQE